MLAQGEHLEDALRREDANEPEVQVVQGKVPHLWLAVVIKGHGEHVQPDEHHDDHVEFFVRHNPENDGLGSPLQEMWLFLEGYRVQAVIFYYHMFDMRPMLLL